MAAGNCIDVENEQNKTKVRTSYRILHWEAMGVFRKVSLVKNIDGPVSFHFCCS